MFILQPVSDKEHEINGEHNYDYDHEAMLGKEEAEEFDQLSPEESKERLGYELKPICSFYCSCSMM